MMLDIYYGDALISKESIIKRYIKFFDNVFVGEKHSVSFALHTGSICFDIISVVAVTLGCLSYNFGTNDDIISGLQIGDMVMYENKSIGAHSSRKRDGIVLPGWWNASVLWGE